METTTKNQTKWDLLESQKLVLLQAIFGAVLLVLGMFLLTPSVIASKNTELLYIAVALLCFKDALVQLVGAVMTMTARKD